MRQKILAANWKMYKTGAETVSFFEELKSLLPKKMSDTTIIVAPPFTSLEAASKLTKACGVKLAAQNMHWEEKGAFTGEISASMLKALGCEYVILGHSERRHVFFETDHQIHDKIKIALGHHLKVIFCVGEKLDERESNQTFSVLEKQLSLGLAGVNKAQLSEIVIAYEPVWAIGTGKVAEPAQAEEAHRFIRRKVWDMYDMDTAAALPILYGGSVKAQNFKAISSEPNVDGALVGGASLEAKSFIEILEQMS
ncbi:MAG: triose-phosphate isomerase [Deltaproteobacteria bacterium]|nr:triose-phosphate isomerase [Deltaproteobacteria bacterium]